MLILGIILALTIFTVGIIGFCCAPKGGLVLLVISLELIL
jgi:hypothetical protein